MNAPRALGILIAIFLGALGAQFLLVFGLASLGPSPAWLYALSDAVVGLSYLLAALLAARVLRSPALPAQQLLGLRWPERREWPAVVLTCAMVLCLGPLTGALGALLTPSVPDVGASSAPLAARALGAFATVLLAPWGEELFFRGVLLRPLPRRWGVVLSAVLFTLVHPGLPHSAPTYLAFALLTGWCASSARSVIGVGLAHTLWNGLIFADVPLTSGVQPTWLLIVCGLGLALLSGLFRAYIAGANRRPSTVLDSDAPSDETRSMESPRSEAPADSSKR